jgi:hypothetical protein
MKGESRCRRRGSKATSGKEEDSSIWFASLDHAPNLLVPRLLLMSPPELAFVKKSVVKLA